MLEVSGPKGRGAVVCSREIKSTKQDDRTEKSSRDMSGHGPARCRHRAGLGTGMCQASTKTEQGVTMSREGQAK